MISQDLVKGMNIPKTVRLSFCEKCVQGNSQWERFIRLGNYNLCIDSDVCGPLFMESIGGKNTLWLFETVQRILYEKKSSISSRYLNCVQWMSAFCLLVFWDQRICIHTIWVLSEIQTNTSWVFSSVIGSSELSGREDQPYLDESAHAMTCQAGVPECYWANAMATAACLRNRTPTRAFKERTLCHIRNGMAESLTSVIWLDGLCLCTR